MNVNTKYSVNTKKNFPGPASPLPFAANKTPTAGPADLLAEQDRFIRDRLWKSAGEILAPATPLMQRTAYKERLVLRRQGFVS